MIIQDIYTLYKIPPHLQLHMLRVAGVCMMICESWTGHEIDADAIIHAALVHDLGNRVKMSVFPGVFEPTGEDLDKFLQTKQDMIDRYWNNDHIANIKICHELNINQKIIDLVDSVEFKKFTSYTLQDSEKCIINYADLRVWPRGVIHTYQRLREAAMRYKNEERLDNLESKMQWVDGQEANILQHCNIAPLDISDESIDPLIEALRKIDIKTNV